jgi:AcrR family transcriptional regulator
MARPRKPLLSRELIVEAANALVDSEGLDAVSMRRLAAELGVSGPSLYNHLRSKDEILEAVADAVSAQVDLSMFEAGDGRGWRTALHDWAHSYRATLDAHPNVVPVLARSPGRRPSALRPADAVFGAMADAGWPPAQATRIGALMRYFVTGSALTPFARGYVGDATAHAPADYPHPDRAHLLTEREHQVDEGAFEAGLRALLDGLTLQYEELTRVRNDPTLIAAVRAGDAEKVRELLDAGADPDAADEHGTTALCLAIDRFDLPVTEALLEGFADVDFPSADGLTPLLRAVDAGWYTGVCQLAGGGSKMWLTDPRSREALSLARRWHEADVETELRSRTGSSEPAERRTVIEGESDTCELVRLGGLEVRTGHTAILTELEVSFGIRVPFKGLLGRAMAEQDWNHVVRWATTSALSRRRDQATWDSAAALRTGTDPSERHFGAEVTRLTYLFDDSEEDPWAAPLLELFTAWAAEESDPRVLASLVSGLGDLPSPAALAAVLPHGTHTDAVVRRQAVGALSHWAGEGRPEVVSALLAHCLDEDREVRRQACWTLTEIPPDTPGVSDALAARVDDEDEDEAVRMAAARALALHDDSRGEEFIQRLKGSVTEDSPYYWHLYDVERHQWLRDSSTAPEG